MPIKITYKIAPTQFWSIIICYSLAVILSHLQVVGYYLGQRNRRKMIILLITELQGKCQSQGYWTSLEYGQTAHVSFMHFLLPSYKTNQSSQQMTRLEDISSLFCTTENYIYVNEEEIFMIYWAKYIHTHWIWEKCGLIHRRLSGVCRWRRKRGEIIYIFIRSTYYLLVFSKHRLIL